MSYTTVAPRVLRRNVVWNRLDRWTSTATASGSQRLPLPPMPRVRPTLASHPPPLRPKSQMREWWDNGSILITLGWSGLALLALDRYLLYQIESEDQAMMAIMAIDSHRQNESLKQEWREQPALFDCVIRRQYQDMGGSHGLADVKVGDVVQVLQEGVGPNQSYHLCRFRGGDVGESDAPSLDRIGWYPIAFMEPVKHASTSWWNKLFFRRS